MVDDDGLQFRIRMALYLLVIVLIPLVVLNVLEKVFGMKPCSKNVGSALYYACNPVLRVLGVSKGVE